MSGPLTQNYDVTYLQSVENRSQNLVTASPVPLPPGGLLLMACLGDPAVLRRRRAEQAV